MVDGNPGTGGGAQGVEFTSIACASTQLCVVGDAAGDAYLSYDPTAAASAQWSLLTEDAYPIDAISCPSVSECVLVDGWGGVMLALPPQSLTSRHQRWWRWRWWPPAGGRVAAPVGVRYGTSPGTRSRRRVPARSKSRSAALASAAGVTCSRRLSAVEVLRRGHIVAVAASGHRKDDQAVVLGRTAKTIPARHRAVITVALTRSAQQLLEAHRSLPALLSVVETNPRRTLVHRRINSALPSERVGALQVSRGWRGSGVERPRRVRTGP